MVLSFEIIRLFDHHNRGQFIAARQLNFTEPVVIEEGALLNGIPVYHYLNMYPIAKEEKEPKFDIYVFRPVNYIPFTEELFQEAEKVELQII